MNTPRSRNSLLACLTVAAAALTARADLTHRYSFNETSGTIVEDLLGNADGTVKGNGAYFDGAGRLALPGGTGSAEAPESIAGYVDLPNHLINVLNSVTLESWVVWEGSGSWQRIFDLGTSVGGEDVANGEGNYLFLSPAGSANLRFAVRDPVTGTEPTQLTAAAPLNLNELICVTVTYDPAANTARLYSNAVLLATGPAPVQLKDINDVNNWLGRSQYAADGMLQGSYDEFRIHNTALNPIEVAASFLAGAGQPSTDPSRLGALQTVNLSVARTSITEGDTMLAKATADFASFAGVSLIGVPGATLTSDNPAVLTADATGLVTAVKAGTARLTLAYQGKTDEETITVSARQTGIAVAGTLVVDLRAADTSDDANYWENRVNPGLEDDFVASGAPAYVANVEGTGVAGVQLSGTECFTGPPTTEELQGGSDRSIEVWVYNPVLADEETLVAWGRRGGPDGSNLSFNYGANGTYGAVGHWGGPDMGWSGNPPAAQWHYLAYTYDGVDTAKVYADGLLKTTRAIAGGLNTHADMPIRVGAQTTGTDPDFAQALSGYVALVRVHSGKLTDADVENNYFYGPTLTPPGELQNVNLTVPKTILTETETMWVTATANFANLAGVSLIGRPGVTLASDNAAVLTVDAAGLVTAVRPGTARLTLAYQGKTDEETINVNARQTGIAVAGSLVVDLRAADASDDPLIWENRADPGTGDDFVASGAPAYVADVEGTGVAGVQLSGTECFTGPPTTGELHGGSDRSIEVWVYNPALADEETLVAWGQRGGGDGTNMSFNYGANGTYGAVGHWGSPDMGWSGNPDAAQWHYLAYTYDGVNTAKVYADGLLKTTEVVGGLNTHPDFPIRVGAQTISGGTDPDFGQALSGYIALVRVHTEMLSDADVANNFLYGPTLTPPTTPPTLAIGRSGANVIISWPTSATGFALEVTPNIGSDAAWTTVSTSGATEEGGMKKLTVPIGVVNQYYRMKQ